ncbi:MAG: winged helix-turn-helix domain-containing protein [Victivallaceae bacterium]
MNKPRFLYQQIADSLAHKINAGFFPEGKLPPERFLAELFGVNRLTLRRALAELKAEQILRAAGRHGTFTLSQGENRQFQLGLFNQPNVMEYPSSTIQSLLMNIPGISLQLVDYNNIKKSNNINIILSFGAFEFQMPEDFSLPAVCCSLDKTPEGLLKKNHCNFFIESRTIIAEAVAYLKNQTARRLAIVFSTTDTNHLKYIPHYNNLMEKSRLVNAPLPVTFINLNYTKNSIYQLSELLRNQKPDGIILATPKMLPLIQAAQLKTRYHNLNTVALAPWGVGQPEYPAAAVAPDATEFFKELTTTFAKLLRNEKFASPYIEIVPKLINN